jgi:hypothetical protein
VLGSSAFEGSYGEPGYRPKEGLPGLTWDALRAVGSYLWEGFKGPIEGVMGPLYEEKGEPTYENMLTATMSMLPVGGLRVGKAGSGGILDAIKGLQRPGQARDLVLIDKLRDQIGLGAKEFDDMIWDLVRQDKVALFKHDSPSSLKAELRGKLLKDDRGNVYNALAPIEPEKGVK